MTKSVFATDSIARPGLRDFAIIVVIVFLMLGLLPIVVWKSVTLGQGDVQVFFRAGWAVWTGYPLYEVTDHHGWTYHYPPTFALLMGPFANPLPGFPRPSWALPFPAAVTVWYLFNAACLLLAVHVWANAIERYRPIVARGGFLQRACALRLCPLFALLPFIGDGLVRGQPAPLLLLLVVLFFVFYVENRTASASLAFSLAVTVKLFPVVLAILPFVRRDWKFIVWAGAWCILLLLVLPAICLGPTTTLSLYRSLLSEHLAGIVSGAMSNKIASEVSPGGFSSIGVGALVARLAAGQAFYSSPLPAWASAVQFLFNAAVVLTVLILGRDGFWNLRGPQPANGYPFLVAGAVLFAATPLMISFAGPQYVTYALPLMAVFLVEAWRRLGKEVLTVPMIAWTIVAWLSMIALEVPWSWVKLAGPMTLALLLLALASLSLIEQASPKRDPSAPPRSAQG